MQQDVAIGKVNQWRQLTKITRVANALQVTLLKPDNIISEALLKSKEGAYDRLKSYKLNCWNFPVGSLLRTPELPENSGSCYEPVNKLQPVN